MRGREYWRDLIRLNQGRRADWRGHPYLRDHRCICGKISCALQGFCHCGCGEETLIADKGGGYGLPMPYSIAGLPSKFINSHEQRLTKRKGMKHSRIAEELKKMEEEDRCLCGAVHCPYQSLCHCGCGKSPKIARATMVDGNGKRISFAGLPISYLTGHEPMFQKGESSPYFKGDRILQKGYWRKYVPDHPRADKGGRVPEHVWIIEQELGRYLRHYGKNHKDNEVVHHADLDGSNNDRDNLELMTHGEHSALHRELEAIGRRQNMLVRRTRVLRAKPE